MLSLAEIQAVLQEAENEAFAEFLKTARPDIDKLDAMIPGVAETVRATFRAGFARGMARGLKGIEH